MPELRISLRGVVYREGLLFIAHCLELDVVGQGETSDEALRQMIELSGAQVTRALEDGDLPSVLRPAPADIWSLFFKGSDQAKSPQLAPSYPISRFEVRELQVA